MMVPLKTEVVPRVAELPTCQKIFEAFAPPLRITWRPDVVVSVEAIWKIQTAFAFPWASSVRSPEEISSVEVDLYRPGARVRPPRFPATVIAPTVRPAASLYAVVKSPFAVVNIAGTPAGEISSDAYIVPVTSVKPKPVIAALAAGLNPTSPVMADVGTLKINEPARIAQPQVDRRVTVACPVVGGGSTVVFAFLHPPIMIASSNAIKAMALSILE